MDVKGNLKISGKVYLNDTNTTLMEGSNNVLRIQSDHGYLDVGPKNTGWCHYSTDRPWHYFNVGLMIDGGQLRSYNEDLSLAANWTNNNNLTQLHLKTGGNEHVGFSFLTGPYCRYFSGNICAAYDTDQKMGMGAYLGYLLPSGHVGL